ncbi:hypothetical protein Tco_1035720 [Tanacetum coccineum]
MSYTSISSDSDSSAWGIPLMDADEVPKIDPYEEVTQQGQAAPPSPAYAPNPIEDEEGSSKDDDDEEEHLAPANSTTVASPAVDLVPFAEETGPFETDESAATPPPPPTYRTTSRMSVRSQAPILFPSEAEVARLLALPTPPPSPLTSLSSPLPQIPSPPLPLPSPPTYTCPTYDEAPLGYRAAEIRLRAVSPLLSPTSPPTHHPLQLPAPSTSHRADIPVADIPPRKRLLLTAPHLDASIRASKRRTMAAIEMVNLRGLEARIAVLETQAHRHEWQCQDADDRATGYIMRIQALEAGSRVDTLEDTGSSA